MGESPPPPRHCPGASMTMDLLPATAFAPAFPQARCACGAIARFYEAGPQELNEHGGSWGPWSPPPPPALPDVAGDAGGMAGLLEGLDVAAAHARAQLEDLAEIRGLLEDLPERPPGKEAIGDPGLRIVVRRLVEHLHKMTSTGAEALEQQTRRMAHMLETPSPAADDPIREAFTASASPSLRCQGCQRKPTSPERAAIARDRLQHGLTRDKIAYWTCPACRTEGAARVTRIPLPGETAAETAVMHCYNALCTRTVANVTKWPGGCLCTCGPCRAAWALAGKCPPEPPTIQRKPRR